ncbi:MAG: hypothetical protein ACTSVI_07670 [Promethearchaeota archaeon]
MAEPFFVYLIITGVPLIIMVLVLPRLILYMKKKGWVGRDIHKSSRPEVAESGGASLFFAVIPTYLIMLLIFRDNFWEVLGIISSVTLASVIGFFDDRLKLSALKKIVFTIFASIPMLLIYLFTGVLTGTPVVPILGKLQVTILYGLFIPAFLTVLMNAVNMLEGYNGEGASTSIVITVALIIGALINGSFIAVYVLIPLLISEMIFFFYNKYPARVFPGDTGTLLLGMGLGSAAIIGNLEFALIIAIIPHAINAFHVIRSVHGFKESSTIKEKDIIMINDDLIKANPDKKAPLTLPRIITARAPLSEPKLVKNIIMVEIVSSSLSVYSSILTRMVSQLVDIVFLAWASIAIIGIILVIALFYPAIRGLILVIVTIFIAVIAMLFLIDNFVIGIGFFNWLVAGAVAAIVFGVWYILSLRYFTKITSVRKKENE